ncbi:hypothetical protein GCM10010349_55680 [Streptomyces flavofungini]|nr:hypothetical protein GCM10010349_55680 [Streptomyces flavofungini]
MPESTPVGRPRHKHPAPGRTGRTVDVLHVIVEGVRTGALPGDSTPGRYASLGAPGLSRGHTAPGRAAGQHHGAQHGPQGGTGRRPADGTPPGTTPASPPHRLITPVRTSPSTDLLKQGMTLRK